MKKFVKLLCLASAVCMLMVSCREKQKISDSYSYAQFGTTLVNASPSGILTIRSWGSGPNEATAIEEAKKNAVADVIFKGFQTSKSYMALPVVREVNARERYSDYFNRFFADGGEYKKFVKETSSSDKSRVTATTNARTNYGITVTVDRNKLEQQLMSDGVLAKP